MAIIKTYLGYGASIEEACFNFYDNPSLFYLTLGFTQNSGDTINCEMYTDSGNTIVADYGYYSNGDIIRFYNENESSYVLCESAICKKSEFLVGCCDNKLYKLKSGKSLLVDTLVSIKPVFFCYRVINTPYWYPKFSILNDDLGFYNYSKDNDCEIMECQPCSDFTGETINTCEPITLLPLQINCEVIDPTEENPISGVLDVAVVGGTQPYQIIWTLLDGTQVTASTVYNQPEGVYTVQVTDRYLDFSATTQCELKIDYNCTFSGSAEEFIPVELSKCYSPSGISGCSGLIGAPTGETNTYKQFTVWECDCPQIYDSGSNCECQCVNPHPRPVFTQLNTPSVLGAILYTTSDLSTQYEGYFMTGQNETNVYWAVNSTSVYCTYGQILPCLTCGSGSSGTSGISGISGQFCSNPISTEITTVTYSVILFSPATGTTSGVCERVTTILNSNQTVWYCQGAGPGIGPLFYDQALQIPFGGYYVYGGSGGNLGIYQQDGLGTSYIGHTRERFPCEQYVARIRPTIPVTPTPTMTPTPTPTLPVCSVTVQFLKNCSCSRTSGTILVNGITAFTWNTSTVTTFTTITASYGQTITIQGNVLTPDNGCSYYFSKLGISVSENSSVTYNSSILTGQNLLTHTFPIVTCNTVITINSSCQ